MKLKLLTLRYGEWTIISSIMIDILFRFLRYPLNPLLALSVPIFAYLQHTWAGTRPYLLPALLANALLQLCHLLNLFKTGWPRILRLSISFLLTFLSAWVCYKVPIRLFPCFRDHHHHLGAHDLKTTHKLTNNRKPNVLVYYPAYFQSEQHYSRALNSDRNLPFCRYGSEGLRIQMKLNKTPYLISSWLAKQHLDVISDAKVMKVNGGDKYTPVVFSHGMFGGLTDYSNLCKAAALSFGNCVVFNLEHSDGSACVHQRQDGSWMIYKTLAEAKGEGLTEYEFRNGQLNHRVDEVRLVVDEILEWKGEVLEGVTVGDLDFTRLAIMGHSFGGITALKVCMDDSRFKFCMCMDPWMFPLSEEDRERKITQPVLFIQNHYFHQTIYEYDNFGILLQLLKHQDLDKIRHFVLTGTGHIFHSDWGIFSGADYAYFFGSHLVDVANCEESMKVNNTLIQQFLRFIVAKNCNFDGFDSFVKTLPGDKVDDVSHLNLRELDEFRNQKFISVKKDK